ncbi:MAG: type II toxin-antitoxin system VapC family toxin [Fimbriimonadaceae bacterium]
MRLVIDASVTLSWCFADEATPEGDAILDEVLRHGATVPHLWHLEVLNILSRAEKGGRIDVTGSDYFLSRLLILDINVDAPAWANHSVGILRLVRRFGLTSYDAVYLELAQRLGTALATLDGDLRTAAATCRVRCIP